MRILVSVSFSFAAAMLAAVCLPWDGWQLYAAGVLLLLAVVTLLLKRKLAAHTTLRLHLMAIFLSAAVAMVWLCGYHRLVVAPVEENYGQVLEVCGTVTDYPIETDSGAKVTISVGNGVKAVYYGDEALLSLQPGQVLRGRVYWQDAGRIRENDITTFTSKGVFVLLYARSEVTVEEGNPESLRWLPQRAKRAVQEKIGEIWRDEAVSGFVTAILTGDRSGLRQEDEVAFSETGLSHLLAVSGLHCTFLVTLLALLIPRGRRKLFAFVTIPVLLFYMLMVGMTPSVVRACVMMIFVLVAPVFWRDSDSLTGLSAALLILLLWNPYSVNSISLQLSFAATAGILFLSPRLYPLMLKLPLEKTVWKRIWSAFSASVTASLGAMLFTAPLTAYYFGIFTVLSPICNLLVVPVAGAAFMVSFLIVLLGFIWLPAAQICGWMVWVLVQYVLQAAHLLMRIPGHALYFTNSYLKYWLVYVYVMLIGCFCSKDRRRKYALTGILAALSLLLVVQLGKREYHYGDLNILALDVGQGESVLLYSSDETVLVDCGSSNSYIDAGGRAADQLHTMGIKRLDAIVVTHYHADHTNGLEELMLRVGVEKLYLPQIEDEYGVKDRLLELAEKYGIDVFFAEQQMTAPLGEAILRIYPPLGEGDMNEQGLTVLCSAEDFDVLITGDMAGSTEKKLVERYTLPDIEVLVVSHHGSKYSTAKDFLEEVKPETAIISVGDNSYGHPSDVVLTRLAMKEIEIYRTDLQGNILLTVHKGEQ
ncbi:MAG: DNA internalization-related competence protein ComEC/Rec2 [Oscillospiraceae bacterium]|nr:DNA internalization-related competence protein ComEC/Rec2 [Oscillospiraceae bacterium]